MKTCEDFELLINLCLDDMLSDDELQMLEGHLRECAVCRERYQHLKAMKAAVEQLEEPAPAGLHDRILDYVEKNTQKTAPVVRKFPARRWYRAIAGVAACAAFAVLAARFVPAMELDAAENNAAFDAPVVDAEMSAPSPSGGIPENMPLPEAPAAPSQDVIMPDGAQSADNEDAAAAPPESVDSTGQMAEDLPPLRSEIDEGGNKPREASIRKWLKVTGQRKHLPGWVDWSSVYEVELEGETREYVEIAAWAETYWLDNLTASGFLVEEMEGQDLAEDGDCVLLFFFWE